LQVFQFRVSKAHAKDDSALPAKLRSFLPHSGTRSQRNDEALRRASCK
jgi:hypothetical protein